MRFIVCLCVTLTCLAPLAAQNRDNPGSSREPGSSRAEEEQRLWLEREKNLNLKLYDALRQGMLNDDVRVRLQSLQGIMAMEGIPDKETLIKDALDDRHPGIRLAILDYYGSPPRPEHRAALQQVIEDRDLDVRHRLADVLLDYQRRGIDVYDHLKLLLEDGQLTVRRRVLEGLAAIDPGTVDPRRLFNVVRDNLFDGVQDIRERALAIVGRLSIELIHDSLEAALQDIQVSFRQQALEIAASIPGPRTTRLMLERLHDGLPVIRARVIAVLAGRMNEDVARTFDNHLQDEPDPLLRIRLLEALAPMRNQTAINVLTRAMDDSVLDVRRRAAALLKEMQETVVTDPLRLRR